MRVGMDYKNSKWKYNKEPRYGSETIMLLEENVYRGLFDQVYRDEDGNIILDRVGIWFAKNGTGDASYIKRAVEESEGLKKKDRKSLTQFMENVLSSKTNLRETERIYYRP
jgi:hypothetical protein